MISLAFGIKRKMLKRNNGFTHHFDFRLWCVVSLLVWVLTPRCLYCDTSEIEYTVTVNKKRISVFDIPVLTYTIKNIGYRPLAIPLTALGIRAVIAEEQEQQSILILYPNQYVKYYTVPVAGPVAATADSKRTYTFYFESKPYGNEQQREEFESRCANVGVTPWYGRTRSVTVTYEFSGLDMSNVEDRLIYEKLEEMLQQAREDWGSLPRVVGSHYREPPHMVNDILEGGGGFQQWMRENFPEHRLWDNYFFLANHRSFIDISTYTDEAWSPSGPLYYDDAGIRLEENTTSRCEKFLKRVDVLVSRRGGDPAYLPIIDELLWRKCAVLYALGREAEADALKNALMSKEPNRIFYFELKQLNETVKELKERIKYGKEEQQESKTRTPKETAVSELHREADEPSSRRTSESARIRRVAYEKQRSGIDKSRVRKREASVTSIIGVTDFVLFVFIILLALVIIIAFFFLFRRHKI